MCPPTNSYKNLLKDQTKRSTKTQSRTFSKSLTANLFEELQSTEIPNGDLGTMVWIFLCVILQ